MWCYVKNRLVCLWLQQDCLANAATIFWAPALCMLQMFCAILVEFIAFAKALSAFERASMWQTAVQLFARMRVADVTPDSISETLRLHLLHTVTQTSKDFLYIQRQRLLTAAFQEHFALCHFLTLPRFQCSGYRMWKYQEVGAGQVVFCASTFVSCCIMFVRFSWSAHVGIPATLPLML